MPSRTLLPPTMSTTVTVMSSPTTKVSPIFRVSTSTVPSLAPRPGLDEERPAPVRGSTVTFGASDSCMATGVGLSVSRNSWSRVE